MAKNSSQYGISEKEIQILREQAAQRAVNRHEFLKQTSNPFIQGSGEGGYVFDKGMQRFQSMYVSQLEHFKPNSKTAWLGLMYCLIPITAFGYALWYERSGRENLYRTGQVAYRDRSFKLI